MIPLVQISTAASSLSTAEKSRGRGGGRTGGGGVDCVGYEGKVKAAMQFVFGSTFVCPTTATASKLTFHPDIARKDGHL